MILTPLLLLAARLDERPDMLDGLSYQTVGMTVVMLALASLWWMVAGLGRTLRKIEAKLLAEPQAQATEAAVREELPASAAVLTDELRAAVAAAVFMSVKEPVRIVSITQGAESTGAWSVEGRRQIFQSHKVR